MSIIKQENNTPLSEEQKEQIKRNLKEKIGDNCELCSDYLQANMPKGVALFNTKVIDSAYPWRSRIDYGFVQIKDGKLLADGQTFNFGYVPIGSELVMASEPPSFDEGALSMQREEQYGAIRVIDEEIIITVDKGKYSLIGEFRDGFAPIFVNDRGYGYINIAGQEVVEPKFNSQSEARQALEEYADSIEGKNVENKIRQ
ncbi:MAG: hypothetical protein FWC33_00735 [Candidatus Bathyarchaeota archaeon]|nr:hypothetical protein [Candidatus Termiticorpusculum sp.]